jgi:hypothetical protein
MMNNPTHPSLRCQAHWQNAQSQRYNQILPKSLPVQERWKIYQFISDHRTRFTIEMMCKVFKVTKSSYYAWLKNGPSMRWIDNEHLLTRIMDIFENSKQTYGSPRITQELRATGRRVSKNRIADMMRAADIRARKPRKFIVTTDSKHNYPIVPNVLDRRFSAAREGEIWISDLTYVRTNSGWLYLTVIIDMYDRKVIGWSMCSKNERKNDEKNKQRNANKVYMP